MKTSPCSVEDILGPSGLLAQNLEGFEFRPSQLEMALLIEEALGDETPAIVEAGTGTGKTFGYLVPLVLSGKKAVVSTGTKNLQEQVFFKDIPLLRKTTGLKIDAVIMKGRRNYLCLYKYWQRSGQPALSGGGLDDVERALERWVKTTRYGDRAELPWLADDDLLWDSLSSPSDQCLGARCPHMEDCFLNRLRKRAAQSRIIIVNHHLFFSDLKVKKGGFGEIIPRFQVAVFDEAHDVEEVATSYLGESLSTRQLTDFADDFEKAVRELKGDSGTGEAKKPLTALRAASEHLKALFQEGGDKDRIDGDTLDKISAGPARDVQKGLRTLVETFGPREHESMAVMSGVTRASELDKALGDILEARGPNWLNWYERRKRSVTLHASPLDVSEQLHALLLRRVETAVFTSATLSTDGTFDYIGARLGLPKDAPAAVYPSHFRFDLQTLMYVPKDLPLPGEPEFGRRAARRIEEILGRTKGRALVLFTSYLNLNIAYEVLKERLPYRLFRQGDAPRSILLESFREDVHSVLLATGSFWQGVDVPGESLSCLIIDKLPFGSPGEPLVAARIDALRSQGKNPFMTYQVPAAIIALKQGLGRLIRKSTDRGILSILDKRLLTSRYGRHFLNSLPKLAVSHDLSDIDRFFERSRRNGKRDASNAADKGARPAGRTADNI